jgi:hypothetical protein
VVNIYDIDSRTYEFKLALPPDTAAAASAIVTSSAVTETESVGGLLARSRAAYATSLVCFPLCSFGICCGSHLQVVSLVATTTPPS